MEESSLFKGFTKVPNHLLNTVMKCQFSGVELKLILAIWRYTSGYSRESAELPLSFLAGEIGSCTRVVSRQMKRLADMNVVQVCYTTQKGIRAYRINEKTESWGSQQKSAVNQTVGGRHDQTVIPAVNQTVGGRHDQTVRGVPTKWSGELSTKWSSNKDNINKILYKKIKEKISLSEKTDKAFEKWLEYKSERGDVYTGIPLATLIRTVKAKAEVSGEDEVIRVIDECIASNYKNIIWEKLRASEAKRDFAGEFLDDYDHETLEEMSRGKRNE